MRGILWVVAALGLIALLSLIAVHDSPPLPPLVARPNEPSPTPTPWLLLPGYQLTYCREDPNERHTHLENWTRQRDSKELSFVFGVERILEPEDAEPSFSPAHPGTPSGRTLGDRSWFWDPSLNPRLSRLEAAQLTESDFTGLLLVESTRIGFQAHADKGLKVDRPWAEQLLGQLAARVRDRH